MDTGQDNHSTPFWMELLRKFLALVVGIIRIFFVIINNLYCIPVHMLWLMAFQPLRLFSPDTYWKLEGIFFRWLLSMVAMWSYSAGYDIVELGDNVWKLSRDRTLVMYNHQSTSDVPLIMAAFNCRPDYFTPSVMWIMDRVFRMTNFGIVSLMHGDFFIRAGKAYRDSSLLSLRRHLTHFYQPMGRKWLVLFPEGGFLGNRLASSQRFAAKLGLPHLQHVTMPRSGALKVILDHSAMMGADGIKWVVDVTVGYPGGVPLNLQTLIAGHRAPCNTVMHYRCYTASQIPRDEGGLNAWLCERYVEKERMLAEYYDTGHFPDAPSHRYPAPLPQDYKQSEVPVPQDHQLIQDLASQNHQLTPDLVSQDHQLIPDLVSQVHQLIPELESQNHRLSPDLMSQTNQQGSDPLSQTNLKADRTSQDSRQVSGSSSLKQSCRSLLVQDEKNTDPTFSQSNEEKEDHGAILTTGVESRTELTKDISVNQVVDDSSSENNSSRSPIVSKLLNDVDRRNTSSLQDTSTQVGLSCTLDGHELNSVSEVCTNLSVQGAMSRYSESCSNVSCSCENCDFTSNDRNNTVSQLNQMNANRSKGCLQSSTMRESTLYRSILTNGESAEPVPDTINNNSPKHSICHSVLQSNSKGNDSTVDVTAGKVIGCNDVSNVSGVNCPVASTVTLTTQSSDTPAEVSSISTESSVVLPQANMSTISDSTKPLLSPSSPTIPVSLSTKSSTLASPSLTLTPASTTQQTPLSTTQQSPASTTQQSPVSTTQQTPASTTQQTPASSTQQSPASTTQQSPVSKTPQTPASTTQQSPVSKTPPTPASTTQQSPVATTRQNPASTTQQSPVAATHPEPHRPQLGKLPGVRLQHDNLEFAVRHLFYMASTYIACSAVFCAYDFVLRLCC